MNAGTRVGQDSYVILVSATLPRFSTLEAFRRMPLRIVRTRDAVRGSFARRDAEPNPRREAKGRRFPFRYEAIARSHKLQHLNDHQWSRDK